MPSLSLLCRPLCCFLRRIPWGSFLLKAWEWKGLLTYILVCPPLIDFFINPLQLKDPNKHYHKEHWKGKKYSEGSWIHENVCSSSSFYEYPSQNQPIYKLNSVVNLLMFEEMRSNIAPLLPNFLAHMFPKVRPRMNLLTFAELIIR